MRFCALLSCRSFTLGATVAQWLRCCATHRKVAGSIPDGVIGIFHWHNPSDRTMALGSTQPLTEMSTRSIFWGKLGRCIRLHCPVPLSFNLGTLTSWNPLGQSRPVTGLIYLLFFFFKDNSHYRQGKSEAVILTCIWRNSIARVRDGGYTCFRVMCGGGCSDGEPYGSSSKKWRWIPYEPAGSNVDTVWWTATV